MDVSQTVEHTCIRCGQTQLKEVFPTEYSYDLFNIVNGINNLLLVYRLLEFTQNTSWVDFDDFRGMYDKGLEVSGMDVSAFGAKIGLLDHHEDECYYVNEQVWQKLHQKMTQIFIFHSV
jgi:hypothetical protein